MSAPSADPKSLGTLRGIFDTQFDYVCHVLRRFGVRQNDVEDAAQETFLAIHAKIETYDPSRPLKPWLIGFVYRIAANYRRKRTAHPDVASIDDVAATTQTPEEELATSQAKTLALRVLEGMDAERRDTLVLHDLEGLSAPEIAALLSLPVNTVYSRLRVAREEFERIAARMVQGRPRP